MRACVPPILGRCSTGRLRALATLVGTAAAVLLPQLATPAASAAATTVNAVRLNGYEAALVASINATRSAHGLRVLVVVPGATDVARRWSWHMAGVQTLSHNPSLTTAISAAGSAAWTMIAENVGDAAATNPSALFTAYMNSAPHRANILDPDARYVGVGVVERGSMAWNTLDFTNAYSSTYGATRVPAAGMSLDKVTITTTRAIATFESRDQRAGTGAVGGVSTTLARFSGPTTSDDRVYATFARHSTTGHGDLILRDAWTLTDVRSLTMRVAVADPLHRALSVQVILGRAYGATVSLGTISVPPAASTITIAVPSTARSLMDTLTLRVQAGGLGTAGGSATLAIYGISANV